MWPHSWRASRRTGSIDKPVSRTLPSPGEPRWHRRPQKSGARRRAIASTPRGPESTDACTVHAQGRRAEARLLPPPPRVAMSISYADVSQQTSCWRTLSCKNGLSALGEINSFQEEILSASMFAGLEVAFRLVPEFRYTPTPFAEARLWFPAIERRPSSSSIEDETLSVCHASPPSHHYRVRDVQMDRYRTVGHRTTAHHRRDGPRRERSGFSCPGRKDGLG